MPILVDFVQRDGRIGERELRSDLETRLPPLDEVVDAYSSHQRRSQLVEALYTTAKRSHARWLSLYRVPLLRPLSSSAPSLRRAQLALAAGLTLLVSLGVAPHSGCGIACWAAESLGFLYAGLTALLFVDGAAESEDVCALLRPTSWLQLLGGAPTPMLRQLALLAVAAGALIVHPYFFLLAFLDLLPAIPRCRAILQPLAKAAPPVLAIAALAAALALPAAAAARAAGAVGECAAGDAAACAVQALAIVAPATMRSVPAPSSRSSSGGGELAAPLAVAQAGTADGEDGTGDGGGRGMAGALAEPGDAMSAYAALGGNALSQLGPLALLALGALMLQLGVAVLVDALADARARTLATREYTADHCLVCGASRSELDRLGVKGFELHVRKTHNPEAYARLLADAYKREPAQRTDDDRWLLECAERADPSFLPSAGREYFDGPTAASLGSLAALGGGGVAGSAGVGWRPMGWEPGAESALGWQLTTEPTSAQLRLAVEQLAIEGARTAAEVRKLSRQDDDRGSGGSRHASSQLPMPPNGSLAGALNGAAESEGFADRLAALERASVLQTEQAAHAAREATRVATELHHRFNTVNDTATEVRELTRLISASSSTVERVKDEVDALRAACGLAPPAPAAAAASNGSRRRDGGGFDRTTFQA